MDEHRSACVRGRCYSRQTSECTECRKYECIYRVSQNLIKYG